tara:strand:+ start:54 stop:440 length:387 start_codon:yes stop_codon:yes gene_type:complete
MKNLLLILCLVISVNSFSQTVLDSTKISNADLEEVFLAIDTLKQQDSIKTILIKDLNLQLNNYRTLSLQDSVIINFKDVQIGLLNEQIQLYDDRLKKVDKWYNKPWVGFIAGCATITLSSWVVHNVSK